MITNANAQNKSLLSQIESKSLQSTKYHALSVIEGTFNTLQLKSTENILSLILPNQIQINLINTSIKYKSTNKFSWFGHVVGKSQSKINFAVVDKSISGSIFLDDQVFEIVSLDNNKVRVIQLNLENFEACEGGIVVDQNNSPVTSFTSSTTKNTSAIDVLIVYSNNTLATLGSVASIESLAQASIDNMNTSLANSQLLAGVDSIHLVAVVGIDRDESGDSNTELNWLRDDTNVINLRNQYGADMVSMLSATTGCGIGYVMRLPNAGFSSFAYQVTKYTCAVGNLTMAHEFGHNLGLEHNPENSVVWPDDGSYPYSYAQYHDGSYRTVMSYSSPCTMGCTRRMYYSNPDVIFNSLATGVVDEKDNVRTLEQTTLIAVDFKESIENIFINGFE
jgi:hypothetical protein